MFLGVATIQDTKSPEYSSQSTDERVGEPTEHSGTLHILFPMLPKPSMKQDTHLY